MKLADVAYIADDCLTEKELAVKWLIQLSQRAAIEMHGGYFGPAYTYKNILFLVDPGHESMKYAGLDAWKVKDVIKLYEKYKDKPDDGYWDDDIFENIENYKIKLEGVNEY